MEKNYYQLEKIINILKRYNISSFKIEYNYGEVSISMTKDITPELFILIKKDIESIYDNNKENVIENILKKIYYIL